MIKEYICIMCPKGCNLTLDSDKLSVTGNSCPRGKEYAISEYTEPKRVITSTVKFNSTEIARIPVKTSDAIEKKYIDNLLKELKSISVSAPVKCGDIIIKNFQNTNIDVIATRTILK